MNKRLGNCGLGWLGTALLCWLFYSKSQPAEIAAAGVIGFGVTVFVDYLARYAGVIQDIRWSPARQFLLQLPRQLLQGITQVAAALYRSLIDGTRPIGSFREAAFGSENHRVAPGRRALIVMAVSFTPNTFAVSFQKGQKLVFHQLGSGAKSPVEEWKL